MRFRFIPVVLFIALNTDYGLIIFTSFLAQSIGMSLPLDEGMNVAVLNSTPRLLRECADSELYARFAEMSDRSALGVLFERHLEMVFLVCRKYLKNDEESRDSAMEIFEIIAAGVRSGPVSNFRNWLYTVSKNHCLMKVRRQAGIAEYPADEYNLTHLAVENEGKERLLQQESPGIDNNLIRSALRQLNAAQEQCIELFYFQQFSYRDIAEHLAISEKQVKSHLQNGKKRLKTILLSKMGAQDE